MSDPLPMQGLNVFDVTQGVAGPHATMLLAQNGANVVKVEPLDGDWGRTLGKGYGDHCAHSIAFNRGKRSLAMDLKNPEALAIAQDLARKADIVVESYRPDVMKRLGMSYEQVKKDNPDVIYLSVTGFGQEGPYRTLPVTDSVIQAFSGLMSINRDVNGTPQRIGMIAIDVMTGLYAYQAIASAVIRNLRFGGGAYIDCSLMQSGAAFQMAKIMEHHLEGGAPQVLYVPVGTMKTADGYINITAMRDHHYAALCEAMGRNDMAENPKYGTRQLRLEHEKEIMDQVRAEFVKKTTAEWAEILTEGGVMNAPVATYDDLLADEQVKAMQTISWIEHPEVGRIPMANVPGIPKADAVGGYLAECPHIGQQSREILGEAGFDAATIDQMIAAKAVAQWG